jgi:excisionase family DNA binding protein
MTVDELAAALNVGRATAYNAVNAGQIPSIRIGKRIVVPTAALRRMLGLDADGVAAA